MPYTKQYPYSERTQRLANAFPSWAKMRQDKDSHGQQLLNTPALILDQAEEYMMQLIRNMHLTTADPTMIDRCFAAELPAYISSDWQIEVVADYRPVVIADSLRDFYRSEDEIAFIDWQLHKIFLRFPHVRVVMKATKGDTKKIETLSLVPQPVWNEFDEFGLLLDTPRLPNETNADYRDRIIYTLRYPANATRLGLIHGLARHFGLIRKAIWEAPSSPLVLPAQTIIETIRVNEKTYPYVSVTEDGVILEPQDGNNEPKTVTYIDSIKLYALHAGKTDAELYSLLYNDDGSATHRLQEFAEVINREAPTQWGDFKYDEAQWDIMDPSYTGLDYIPNVYDADIEAWRNWKD